MTQAKPDLTTTSGKLTDLRNRLAEAQSPVGDEAIEATHAAGDLTARERLLALLDEDSFVETDALARHRATEFKMDRTRPATDGVVTGYGLVGGRRVCVFSQDDTVFDGALGEVYAEKILKVYDLATKTGVPVVGIYAGVGPRLAEGVVTLGMYAKLFKAAADASGLVPQIAVVSGSVQGLQSVGPWLADLVIGLDHDTAHLTATDDAEAIARARTVLSYLPVNNRAEAPRRDAPERPATESAALDTAIPDAEGKAFDVRAVLTQIVDDATLLEVKAGVAGNVLTAFAHVDGRPVGVIANQPTVQDAVLDAAAANKAARFIRTCDAFNLPIVQFVDSAGIDPAEADSPTVQQAAAQLAYANAEASVGKITVVLRRALGSAYVLMGAKDTGADLVYAWPTAQIAVTGAQAAAAALDADVEKYAAEHLNPYRATELGLVDAVIEPSTTRAKVADGLLLLERKVVVTRPKKHGNIPL